MDKVLIVIDYTYDFVAADGLLTCGGVAQEIDFKISSLMKKFADEGQYIVIANDIHLENDFYHPQATLFPPHNMADTKGRELYGQAGRTADSIILEKGRNGIYILDKTRYSAFAGTDLEIKLRERKIDQIHLAGVCTDICVLHTAVDAYNKGFQIVVHKDAVASFNAAGHEWALSHFVQALGAQVL